MTTKPSPVEALPDDDAALAARVADRDERAFEALMRRHNRMLYRLARAVLNDDAEAEDALQDAYLAAYRAIGSYRGGAKLSTWLARIALNAAYARLRKRPASADVVALRVDIEPPADDSAETAAMRAELRALLMRKIDELPEQFRVVYVLRDVEEQSVEEVAAILGLPAATVRTRAFRARALLREALSREIDTATVDAFEFAGARCDHIVASVLARIHSND
jgi:RNA polymerase sigma-70 factor, ECF subfamily